MASGVEQIGRGYLGRRPVITLHFRAAVGEPRSFDSVEIKGRPNLTSIIDGGVNGDIATCAIVLNAVGSVIAAKPGLKTMLEVPAVTFCD
jgi:4-hydroxy-tetrahydrodipicolinate reductase